MFEWAAVPHLSGKLTCVRAAARPLTTMSWKTTYLKWDDESLEEHLRQVCTRGLEEIAPAPPDYTCMLTVDPDGRVRPLYPHLAPAPSDYTADGLMDIVVRGE